LACPWPSTEIAAAVFVRNDNHGSPAEELAGQRHPTHFGCALEQLGITFITAQSPQAKGRVERLWGVLQDRLKSELRLAKADDPDSTNRVLRAFIADYNRRFARRRQGLALDPGRSGSHLLFRASAHRQQRQPDAMGSRASADSSAVPPLSFEKSCSVVTSFGPAALEIFGEALDFRWTPSERFALGKLSGPDPAPHRSTVQVSSFADLLVRTVLPV
jgi:hypothetical protein